MILDMDPYYKVKYGEQEFKSHKVHGGHKTPTWKQWDLSTEFIWFPEDGEPSGSVEISIRNDGKVLFSKHIEVQNLIASKGKVMTETYNEDNWFMVSAQYTNPNKPQTPPYEEIVKPVAPQAPQQPVTVIVNPAPMQQPVAYGQPMNTGAYP